MMIRRSVVLMALVGAVLVPPALAQSDQGSPSLAGIGFGLKGGFGTSPDQVVLGAQYSLGKRVSVFRLVPNFDVGFGDAATTADFNLDFLARAQVEGSSLAFYAGGAPTLGLANDKVNLGITLVVGVQLPILERNATNIEARFGIGDIPDFRALFTIIF
jgi:hypothetical protein